MRVSNKLRGSSFGVLICGMLYFPAEASVAAAAKTNGKTHAGTELFQVFVGFLCVHLLLLPVLLQFQSFCIAVPRTLKGLLLGFPRVELLFWKQHTQKQYQKQHRLYNFSKLQKQMWSSAGVASGFQ